jgi:anthranilate phosphoribosyltransferase
MIQQSVKKLAEGKHLSKDEAYESVKEIMSGNVSEILISSFLTALRLKGETISEIAGAALAMREMAVKITHCDNSIIDTCGTGGDGSGTFNISTIAAIIASGAGAKVAKHGNRAVSSKCGSADVLKSLGVNIEIPIEKLEQSLEQVGIVFLFAPAHHGAMKYAGPVRRELGFRTIFNILGPLTNPAGAKKQLLGVFREDLTEIIAEVLRELGSERALIVHGIGGMDEISTVTDTKITELNHGTIRTMTIDPVSFGFQKVSIQEIAGGDSETNRDIVISILNGKKSPYRDIAVFNAAAALYVAGIAETISDGIHLAVESIDAGKAKQKLHELIRFTN